MQNKVSEISTPKNQKNKRTSDERHMQNVRTCSRRDECADDCKQHNTNISCDHWSTQEQKKKTNQEALNQKIEQF
jgi:hypothetical protein